MSDKTQWITLENGTHIPIKEGQTKEQAVREFTEKHKSESGGGKRVGADKAKTNVPQSERTTIKQEVTANAEKLKGTKVLAAIPKGKMITDFKTAVTTLKVKLSKNGGVVTREGFGDIQVGARLKQAGAYIKTTAEIAALATVPTVIKNGVKISEHKNHKGREYESTIFAGKVSIGEKEGIVAVAVTRTTGNFYKVHRVLTPDGKSIEIEKDTD